MNNQLRNIKVLKNRWHVISTINKGGQAIIKKVKDKKNDKIYAAKIFSIKKFQKERLERALREIEIIKNLKGGANIIQIYDDNVKEAIEGNGNEIFYIMDFSKYGSLKDNDFYFEDVELVLKIFKEILIGISNAHKKSIIHRDLKPENILFFPTQKKVVISDFGIGLLKRRWEDSKITESEEFLGPIFFISPEQFTCPSKVDERADIYSLGKILYFMLTRNGKTFREELEDLNTYFKESNPYIPLIQENLIKKMVLKEKNKRFKNTEEILDEVNLLLSQISINSKRYLQITGKKFNFYKYFIRDQNAIEDYIKNFSKDLVNNLFIFEIIVENLLKERREKTLDKIYEDLLAKFPTKGKINCAIKCVYNFINNPRELINFKNKYKRYSFPNYYLSKYYFNAKSYDKSHEEIIKSINLEGVPKIKLEYILFFSKICKMCKCTKKHNPDELLKDLIINIKDKSSKIKLYKIMGNHFLDSGQKREGLRYLETFLNVEPFDKDLRFTVGYEYSQLKDYSSSLFHYTSYINSFKEDGRTVNNIGVIYQRNGMILKAMEKYRKALDLGNTLAGSNMAKKYIEIGLKKDALELLRKIIRENEEYDKDVDNTFGLISNQEDKEKEKEEKLLEDGKIINYHNAKYINQLTESEEFEWIGCWEICDNYAIKIESKKNKKTISQFETPKIKLIGNFDRNCFDINKLELNSTQSYNGGVIYLLNNNEFKGYAIDSDKKILEIEGKRIKNPDEYSKSKNKLLDAFLKRAKINN